MVSLKKYLFLNLALTFLSTSTKQLIYEQSSNIVLASKRFSILLTRIALVVIIFMDAIFPEPVIII